MKTKPVSCSNSSSTTLSAGFSALALAALLVTTSGNAQTDATAVRISNTGQDLDSLQTFQLGWDALSNATYLVQSANSLAPGSPWQTLDAVQSPDTVGTYQVRLVATASTGLSSAPAEFYRLALPQPQIFSVEPAVVAPGVPVDFYVFGQCFDTNDVLLINGVAQTDVTYTSSQLVKLVFTPGAPGVYTVQLSCSGVVVSSFNVTCADAAANPELVLQGPPQEPPASPSKKDFKGHVTLMKAFDDGSGDARTGGGGDDVTPGTIIALNSMMAAGGGGDVDCDGIVARNGGQVNNGGGVINSGGSMRTADGGDCDDNDPTIHPWSGELCDQVMDLAIPGRGLDFIWARTYNSRIGRFNAYGTGWTCSYDVRCAQNSSGGLDVYDGTGRKDTFNLQTNGTYTCPQFFREGTISNNTFTLTFADTGRWVFNPFDGSAAAGKLISIITRNGDTMTLGYDTSGRLAQIVDDLGRTNTVGYNSSGQLASVTDFSGRTVTYQYYQGQKGDNGGAGDLKSVTSPSVTGTPDGNDFPDGKTVTYTYSQGYTDDRENHLLLSVIDAKGQTTCTHVYQHNQTDFEFLRCISVQHGTNTPAVFTYLPQTPAPSNHFAVVRCVMNDPVGDVTESFCDARNRCVTERDYTGRATPGLAVTDTDNRPTGKLRSSDPDYYECRADWNNDSLCTLAVAPGGQQVQCVYESDFDNSTPARKRADCRVVREIASSPVDLDGDGVADVTERSWHFDYDPRFGSDRSAGMSMGKPIQDWIDTSFIGVVPAGNGMAINQKGTGAEANRLLPTVNKRTGMAMELFFDGYEKGLIVPDGNGMAIKTKGTGADKNRIVGGDDADGDLWPEAFVTSMTDPRGRAPAGVTHEYHRFVTSSTDPRGNVTMASYDGSGNKTVRVKLTREWSADRTWRESYAYDSHGERIAITNAADANGRSRVDTFSWSQGQITNCVLDAGGLALTSTFEYDARGNLTRCVDPRTNDWLFTYNALDQCVQAQSPPNISARCATDFAYDANDNLVQVSTEVRDAGDNLVGTQVGRASYDSLHRLTEVALDMDATRAQTNRYVYDGNNQCVQMLGPDAVSGTDPHQAMSYEYDERGLLFHEIAAAGSSVAATNEYDYDGNGNTARVNKIEAISIKQITISRDGFDRLASIADPMGNQTVYFYDANDNLKVVRQYGELNDVAGSAGNVRLAESRFEYDGLDRCFREHDLFFNPVTQSPIGSGEAVSTCVYAPNGECVSVTDSLGRTTSFSYDTACRLSSVTDARGNQVVCVRDPAGNVTSLTSTELPDSGSPQVFSTACAYDSLNRCVSSSDNVGNTSTCAYDSLDRVVRETNPNGNDTTYAYDLLDNGVACVNYAGSSMFSGGKPPIAIRSSQATYDTSSRCLTSTDANGNTTSYAYDSLGDCTLVTRSDGTQEQLVWSPRSNLIELTDPNGTTITNIYDLCEKIIHRDLACRNVLATTTFETFAYDGCGRLVLVSNDVSQLTFSYDSLGDCTGSSQDGLAQSATFDSEGNPLSLTYPGGRVVTYAYDVLNQVTNISTSGGGVSHPQLARFAYAGPGRLAGIARDNGINTRITWNGLVNPANGTGDYGWQQVSAISDGSNATPSSVVNVTGTYSPAQSKLTRADAGRSLTLTYDPLEQLVESALSFNGVPALDTMYALDAAGNRQHVITNGVMMTPDYAMNNAVPPGDFQMNRYTTTPFGPQTYDANGNLIVRADAASPKFYQYDYADRLVEVDGLDTNGLVAPLATFTYDALGNRISKTSYLGAPAVPVTVQYVRSWPEQCDDGNDIIEERVNGAISRSYCYWNVAIGLKLAGFTATGEPQYYHCDDLGNVLALTDSGGNVLERYAYDDYGQPQFLDASGTPLVDSDGQPVKVSPLGNSYLFHGLEWDGESGLLGDGGGDYFDPLTVCAVRGKVKSIKDMGNNGRAFSGNNPWSGGGGGGTEMKNGTIKFFNETKGFVMVVGGGSMGKTHTKTGHVTLMK